MSPSGQFPSPLPIHCSTGLCPLEGYARQRGRTLILPKEMTKQAHRSSGANRPGLC